jgi:hypothetical protein
MGFWPILEALHHGLIIYFALSLNLLYFYFLKIMANNKTQGLIICYRL